MPHTKEANATSLEPEQVMASDSKLESQLEIHTIPEKFYGAATRASIEDTKPKAPIDSGGPKRKSSVLWISIVVALLVVVSAGGFVYFNQSLIFGEKEPIQGVAEVPPVASPPVAPVLPPAPQAPTGLSISESSQNFVRLNWVDASDDETGFRIERRELTTDFSGITSVTANSTAYLDPTVSPDTEYFYRVIASNDGGDSPSSIEVSVKTPAEPPPEPEPAKLPPAGLDTDSDGVTDLEEPLYGTDINKPDTDGDSFLDGNEVFHLYNPASGLNMRLLDTGLVKTVDSPIGWSIYVPSVWSSMVSEDGMSATFETGHGEVFAISMKRNTDRKSVMDWYLDANPGVLSTQLNMVTTKSGIVGLESQNKLHTYFAWGEWVVDFEYQLDGQPFVNFRQTYEMMKNSLKLNGEPVIGGDINEEEGEKEGVRGEISLGGDDGVSARDAQRIADMGVILKSLLTMSLDDKISTVSCRVTENRISQLDTCEMEGSGEYINLSSMKDPLGESAVGVCGPASVSPCQYGINESATPEQFIVYFFLESGNDEFGKGIHTVTEMGGIQ